MKQISGIIIIIALIGLLFGAAFVCGCTGTTENSAAQPAPVETTVAPVEEMTVEETAAPVAEATMAAEPVMTSETIVEEVVVEANTTETGTNMTAPIEPVLTSETIVEEVIGEANATGTAAASVQSPVPEQNASEEMVTPSGNETVTSPVSTVAPVTTAAV